MPHLIRYLLIPQKHTEVNAKGYEVKGAGALIFYPNPSVIIAKSVCDFADADKNDDYQQYAAYTSAQFFLTFYKKLSAQLLEYIYSR